MVFCLLAAFGSAQASVVSLESYSNGDWVPDFFANGVNVTVNSSLVNGREAAMIFDTRIPSAQDPDLNGPFTNVRDGSQYTPGNVIILSENGSQYDPDDNNGPGFLEFIFDVPVQFDGFNAFDINDVDGLRVELYDSNGLIFTVRNQYAGADNSYEEFLRPASNVTRAVFNFHRTGAVGDFRFAAMPASEVPNPPSLILFGSVVAFLAHRRGKKGLKLC
ncbi:MAG: hypothetical protein AAGG79_00855 [Pseudomonadota bacterium]